MDEVKKQNKNLVEKVASHLESSGKQVKKDRDIVQKLSYKLNSLASKNDLMKIDDRVGNIFDLQLSYYNILDNCALKQDLQNTNNKLTYSLSGLSTKFKNLQVELETNHKILERFDEIITEKASKISIEEISVNLK